MNINILSSSRFSSRLVAILMIVLIQLPAVSLALDLKSSIQPTFFPIASRSNLTTSPLTVFSNTTPIVVTDATAGGPGTGAPYPSPIVVSGMSGTISDVNVTISGITAPRPRDLDFLLVAPGGQSLLLLADAGGTGVTCAITTVTLTLDDAAATQVPELCPPVLVTGTYRPANYTGTIEPDSFPAPAPAGPYGQPAPAGVATLAIFNTLNPNGTWNLYVVDDALGGLNSTITGGWSIDITTVGGIDPTTTVVNSSVNPALTTQNITFTSTTTNNTTGLPIPAAAGTVNFTNNGVTIPGCGAVPIAAGGQAQCTAMLAEGTRLIVANYSGTATLGLSSGNLTQVVNFPTSVAGAQFCNNGGISIPESPGVAVVYPSNITVSGMSGTVSTMTVSLNDFTAARPTHIDFLLVGANSAAFEFMSDVGDSVNAASNLDLVFADSAATQMPQGTAIAAGTFRPTDYIPAADPDTYPAPAPGAFSKAAPAGAATLTSMYTGSNPNGTWSLYSIDDSIAGGASTISGWCVNFTLTPFATTTTVTSNADPSVFGQTVTFTASVTTAGNGTPTAGTVTFFDGINPISGAIALNGSGQASFMTSSLAVGNHTISAQYSGVSVGAGGGGFAGSTGAMTGNPQVVNQASTTTGVASSVNPSSTGQQVTFTVTVNPVAPGAGTRTGTVDVLRDGQVICNDFAINASGQATCNMTFTVQFNYNITAVYSGDGNFLGSNNNSSPLVQQVLGPTAAPANISGRVLDLEGRGVGGAQVSLQNQAGEVRWAITNPFGYYRFVDVPSGQTYLISVGHKRFEYQPRTLNVIEDLADIDFIPMQMKLRDPDAAEKRPDKPSP